MLLAKSATVITYANRFQPFLQPRHIIIKQPSIKSSNKANVIQLCSAYIKNLLATLPNIVHDPQVENRWRITTVTPPQKWKNTTALGLNTTVGQARLFMLAFSMVGVILKHVCFTGIIVLRVQCLELIQSTDWLFHVNQLINRNATENHTKQ